MPARPIALHFAEVGSVSIQVLIGFVAQLTYIRDIFKLAANRESNHKSADEAANHIESRKCPRQSETI